MIDLSEQNAPTHCHWTSDLLPLVYSILIGPHDVKVTVVAQHFCPDIGLRGTDRWGWPLSARIIFVPFAGGFGDCFLC